MPVMHFASPVFHSYLLRMAQPHELFWKMNFKVPGQRKAAGGMVRVVGGLSLSLAPGASLGCADILATRGTLPVGALPPPVGFHEAASARLHSEKLLIR